MAKTKTPKKGNTKNPPPVAKPTGRPRTELTDGVFDILEGYRGPGTVSDLCRELNISNTVFYKWLNQSVQFNEIIKRIRDRTDDEVESALLKRAIGFEYTEVRNRQVDGGGGEGDEEKHVYEEVTRYVPGDVGAQKHWLSVRRPEWNVVRKVEVSTDYHRSLMDFIEGEAEDVTDA